MGEWDIRTCEIGLDAISVRKKDAGVVVKFNCSLEESLIV